MQKLQKSTTLYKTPFSKAYWRDAAMELRDTKMLAFAALIIALRVALKTFVRIPLAPNLDITPAFLANALGAMVYGPVVGALGAIVSDFLGVMLRGDTYFLPYVLTEIAGSVIFALFFYRAKITPTRVILSRFCICLFVNILLQTPIDILFQIVTYGKSSYVLTLPRILKNLFMFPIESVVLTLFLSVMQPITYRMKLTYNSEAKLSFSRKQIVLLAVLVVVGAGCVFGYMFVHYDNTSLSAAYSKEERAEKNHYAQDVVLAQSDDWDEMETVTIVESAFKKFLGKEITYTVAVYQLDETAEYNLNKLWGYSKSGAAKDPVLTRVATVTFVVDEKTGEILSFEAKETK